MKNIAVLLLLLFATTGISQNLDYQVRGTYTKSITKERLNEAESLIDINPGYPASWISETDYISSIITANTKGQTIQASSVNDMLSAKQKSIVNTAELGTDIAVQVKYKEKNSVTQHIDTKTMNFVVTLVPESEAEYVGGYEELEKYLAQNAITKISETKSRPFQYALIKFTVNEEGQATDAQIAVSSEDENIDQLLLDTIVNMPRWRAAKNAKGLNVKQDFELSVGSMVGC